MVKNSKGYHQDVIIAAEQNPSSKYTRHIDAQENFINEKPDNGAFFLSYLGIKRMLADTMMKPLPPELLVDIDDEKVHDAIPIAQEEV